MSVDNSPKNVPFDMYDHEIRWQPFAGIENLELSLCDIDEERKVVDLIVRFAPNKTVTLHNHLAQTNMFIIQGELRMYEPDGSVREVRPAGRYYRGRTNDAHSEGGGPQGAVVFY
ncbi:MAG: regulator, partial [Myxococcales bacterium]|nr:regulator [Myxococcales bacterium]